MSDGPNRRFGAQARQQSPELLFEDAAFDLDGGPGALSQPASEHRIAFGRPAGVGNLGAFLGSGTDADPRGQLFRARKALALGPHFGDDLVSGDMADARDLHQPADGWLPALQRPGHL